PYCVTPLMCLDLALFLLRLCPSPTPTLFPYMTLFRSPAADARRDRRGGVAAQAAKDRVLTPAPLTRRIPGATGPGALAVGLVSRSEEHTSELQSRVDLVCRLLLEKKKYQ